MAIAAVVEFPRMPETSGEEAYDRVSREFNGGSPMTRPADWGPGLISHVAGAAEDGSWWVVDVWESQDAMDDFMGRMMPLLQPMIDEAGTEPAVTVFPVHNLVLDEVAQRTR